MPTYEYRCGDCGSRFDVFQSINAQPERRCRVCGEDTAERLISAGAGIVFKGSGFYATDYRDPPPDSAKVSGDDSGGGGGSGGESKDKTGNGSTAGGAKSSSGEGSAGKGKGREN